MVKSGFETNRKDQNCIDQFQCQNLFLHVESGSIVNDFQINILVLKNLKKLKLGLLVQYFFRKTYFENFFSSSSDVTSGNKFPTNNLLLSIPLIVI